MNYKNYDAEDFAQDAFFIRWVRNPDEESDWFWNAFLKEHPEKHTDVEKARHLIRSFSFPAATLQSDEKDQMRDHLKMAIRADREKEKEDIGPRPRKATSFRWLQAAAVLLMAATGIAAYRYFTTPVKELAVESTSPAGNTADTEERVNPRGQKSVLILEDGTKVWLNADSRLHYSKDFNARARREVSLEGEAYFDVVSNPGKPFIIHTAGINIRVLGTSFNVKSYQDDQVVETTLVHGKVSIAKDDDHSDATVVLKPNQKAVFEKRTQTINIEEVANKECAPWRYDRLVFDATPFHEVITQLERWYNVRIHTAADDVLGCELTADIENESLDDVLKLLQTTNKISYAVTGSDVYIKGKLCE